jgi:hypothetical protein
MSESSRSQGLSRRGFTAALALAQTAAAQPPRSGPPPEAKPFEGTIEFARRDVPAKAEPFPLSRVRLLPGIYQDAADWNRGYVRRLTADRLLYNFRANSGLPTGSAKPLGGWEQPANNQHSSELRGHFTGHFLTACAQLHASMGDAEAKAKGDELVAALAKCQEKLGGGYLSAFPTEFFDRLDARKPVWAPFYTIHKIMAGMFDMYRLAGNRQALQVLEGMAAWADGWTASKSEEHMQDILNTEFGGMAETLYNLAAATGNDRWVRAGDRFTKKRFMNPLALRRDELRGLHVNTHIPQVIAAARRYEISGDTRFHDVADYFFREVSTARSYVTAGTSNGEHWQTEPRRLGAELKRSVDTAECCCSYNMLKLARHLYGWDPNPRYFDYYERAMLNHRIGTIRPEKGWTQYYLSLTPGAWKTFNTEDQSFWCCTGTGVEEYSKLADSIYWHDAEGLYVNQFIASELDWAGKGLKLRQETKFPEEPGTALVVTAKQPVRMTLRLRVPGWLRAAPAVKLNGRTLEASAAPGGYLVLARTWKTGDRVEMALPMHLHMEAMPDEPRTQAVLYGPLVLAGDLGSEGLTEELIVGPEGPRMNRRQRPNEPARPSAPPIEVPAFQTTGKGPDSWIKPADAPLTFRTAGQRKDVTLLPLNRIFDRRYSVYWEVS